MPLNPKNLLRLNFWIAALNMNDLGQQLQKSAERYQI